VKASQEWSPTRFLAKALASKPQSSCNMVMRQAAAIRRAMHRCMAELHAASVHAVV
jgi:DNA-binding FrmR family transcriptional regulator